ncbi:668_t:CDS:2 [Funneliformis geosporum]|nr:668_t:CDS:2 [Funneliformis geosporum]
MFFRSIRNRNLTTGISRLQLQDQGLWICYNDECVSLPENILEIFNVGNLIPIIKVQLKIKGDIAIRNGSDILEKRSLAQAGVDLTNILHLASQKIHNFNKNKKKDHLANLVCISCSFALEVCPQIAKVKMLIASHMITAIGISDDRIDLLCTYPSNPILASEALKEIIKFSCGVVEAREREELVSRILFLKAYVHAVKINQLPPVTYLKKIPLSIFLKALCKGIDEKIDDLLVKMHINEAEIGFNH